MPPVANTAAPLRFRVLESITDVAPAAWNALVAHDAADAIGAPGPASGPESGEGGSPFLEWGWLEAMESSGCASADADWAPRHLALFRDEPRTADGAGGPRLVAAAPAYLRTGSDGDFARDWGYADAARRAGYAWYPKLAITVPFTPVTGRRFLVAPGEDRAACVRALVDGAVEAAREEGAATVQALFLLASELPLVEAAGLAPRLGFQFHWSNLSYREPADYLARFDSKRRNQLKRERAAPDKQGIAIRTVRGDELAADARRWAKVVHGLHRSTVEKLMWGRGWLDEGFYQRAFANMAHRFEVVVARHAADPDGRVIAGAFNVASATRLFGRYWGCHEDHPFLHFNVCLYHSIDACIQRGVRVFEGGAGGEHKLPRGFLPTETWAAFRCVDPRLDAGMRRLLARETEQVRASLERFRAESPIFKKGAGPTTLPDA